MIAIVFLMVARVLLNGFYDILKPLSHSHFGNTWKMCPVMV